MSLLSKAFPFRQRFALIGAALLLMMPGISSAAENADNTLLAFAVNVHRTPVQSWQGYGIYMGKGVFFTAAHVAGRAWMTRPKIVIDGKEYPTRVIKEGSLDAVDITVMAVEESLLPIRLRLRHMRLCATPPRPGEQVVTAIPGKTVRSHILAPEKLPPKVRRFSTVIADVAETGNSGSGVFRVQQRCLLGIMSRKISQTRTRSDTGKPESYDIAKYFVPATDIVAFLPLDLRF